MPALQLRVVHAETPDYRMRGPVVPSCGPSGSPTLGEVYRQFRSQTGDRKSARTWEGYEDLLRAWEKFHSGPGPGVRSIDDAALRAFFEGQPAWGRRSWQKYCAYFSAILKSVTVRSDRNRSGPPPGEELLSTLPYLEIPSPRWFAARGRGQRKKKRIDLLTADEFSRVLAACAATEHPRPRAPLFWRFLHSWIWVHGFRLRDALTLPWSAINLAERRLDFVESKRANYLAVPMHPRIVALLEEIRRETEGGERVLWPPKSYLSNAHRWFYPRWRAIWQRAGVDLHNPHELRSASITHWKEHSPAWWKHATGHSLGGDVREQHYVLRGAPSFREAVEAYPLPAM